ncbi:hypothetical protein LCGC14_0944830 [marine sediment metagenome]|uniref:NTP pyrophosphohydrolase MazG-like domain-containing protein n=1 Tax=marine sediment metagenome TaxID=412755 RepID=A0A0F9RQD2_9ZZZZ
MNLEQYVRDATRTESRIDEVKVNRKFLVDVLTLFVSAGNMLDQIKKHVFYGKEYRTTKLNLDRFVIKACVDTMVVESAEAGLDEETTIDVDPRLFHAIVGLATEATELTEALANTLIGSNTELDGINILEELGDLNWYEAIAIDTLNGDFENVLATNIDKLRERFPEKFTSDNAINRDVDKERALLEEKL